MDLLRQAATIMVLGMGLVFVFLALVILFVQNTARLIRRYERASGEEPAGFHGDGMDDPVAAAIAIALHERD